ncbi:MAG: protein adenylyltransferase SelO family protein [Oligoflexia bacterium]|nr:protein adenylyltransferase SelO family protein [Oligoflexia bacterium]
MKPAAFRLNLQTLNALVPQPESQGKYASFDQINGNHPWKYTVPNGFIDYEVRILRGSKIVYFNFNLAKEMGLIAKEHPHKLNKDLENKLVETFSLRIINEYDQLMGFRYPKKDIKPNRYMATRYLQLQHSIKNGSTSGDGRSMWNGNFLSPNGVCWDISSCGTGVTRLSPGYAKEFKPIQTGDPQVSYGSGLADIDEGVSAAILSESFHARGILTERTLLVIETADGNGINIRAAKDLLRPSHLFLHLKQNNQLMLKSSLDYFIAKQVHNRMWKPIADEQKYDYFLKKIVTNYSTFAAQLEEEYIFCWLDWDGDNMLMSGGIIDYGSIRQMGLCHHHYRYDDVDRYSTNLKEQKNKAKYLVQTFIQMIDFVRTGIKNDIKSYAKHPLLDEFESNYKNQYTKRVLQKTGFSKKQTNHLIKNFPNFVNSFMKSFTALERVESKEQLISTPDGINNPPLFNVRNILEELPKFYLKNNRVFELKEFIETAKSPYLKKKHQKNIQKFQRIITRFQKDYISLLEKVRTEKYLSKSILECAMRASSINRKNIVTGDGIIHVVNYLLDKRKTVNKNEFIKIIDAIVNHQQGHPIRTKLNQKSKKILKRVFDLIQDYRFTI